MFMGVWCWPKTFGRKNVASVWHGELIMCVKYVSLLVVFMCVKYVVFIIVFMCVKYVIFLVVLSLLLWHLTDVIFLFLGHVLLIVPVVLAREHFNFSLCYSFACLAYPCLILFSIFS